MKVLLVHNSRLAKSSYSGRQLTGAARTQAQLSQQEADLERRDLPYISHSVCIPQTLPS